MRHVTPSVTASESFDGWDGYPTHPGRSVKTIELTLGGSKSGPDPDTFRLPFAAKPLGLNYEELLVHDDKVKQVTILNNFTRSPNVGVELWANTADGWRRINLTRQPDKSFCFDDKNESFGYAILAISNASEDVASQNIDVAVAGKCDPHVTFDGTSDCSGTCSGAGFAKWSWSGTAKLQLVPSPFPGTPSAYQLVSGTVTVTVTRQTPDGCTLNGNTTVPLTAGLDTVDVDLIPQPPSYQFTAVDGSENVVVTYTGCTDPPPPTPLPLATVAFAQTSTPISRDPAATTLEDTVDSQPSLTQPLMHYHWQIFL